MRRLEVYCTFIVKHQQNLFPMEVLRAVLRARYPKRAAGHWVVMKATISEVDLYIMAYAWSNKGVSYMVSTCGTTVQHEKHYMSSYEDEFGNRATKELARPAIAHMLYEFLPLIDEHNKARQSFLALERCWVTQSGFFRTLTTMIGMSVVDLQRWDRSKSCGDDGTTIRSMVVNEEDFDIKEMANLIAKPLRTGELTYRKSVQPSMRRGNNGDDDGGALTRIRGEDGSINYPPANPNKYGKPRQQSCFVCRQYNAKHKNTQWMCKTCGMPLCQVDRERTESCVQEHMCSNNGIIRCRKEWHAGKFLMPDNLKLYLRTREGKRIREAQLGAKKNKRKQGDTITLTPSPNSAKQARRSARGRS